VVGPGQPHERVTESSSEKNKETNRFRKKCGLRKNLQQGRGGGVQPEGPREKEREQHWCAGRTESKSEIERVTRYRKKGRKEPGVRRRKAERPKCKLKKVVPRKKKPTKRPGLAKFAQNSVARKVRKGTGCPSSGVGENHQKRSRNFERKKKKKKTNNPGRNE